LKEKIRRIGGCKGRLSRVYLTQCCAQNGKNFYYYYLLLIDAIFGLIFTYMVIGDKYPVLKWVKISYEKKPVNKQANDAGPKYVRKKSLKHTIAVFTWITYLW
jgi:hypothetical protein